MTKKGPFSKSEKQYIQDNQELPSDEIAEALDRSEKSVNKYLATLSKQKPAVSATISGSEEEEPDTLKAGQLMARNKKYGSVTMTEQASMVGDESKPKKDPKEVNVAKRHRGSIHRIKGD